MAALTSPLGRIEAAIRLWETTRHLRIEQVCARLGQRLPVNAQCSSVERRKLQRRKWKQSIRQPSARTGANEFCFLNQIRTINGWTDRGIPKLWLYNLHYFDYTDVDVALNWIAQNPAGTGIGWEPYPTSRRIVNWIKWSLNGGHLAEGVLRSLATQAEYLSNKVEYHLLANHLFANAKALVFAGTFFGGRGADRWLALGSDLLHQEVAEQVLRDGGHFERSPMYHSIILEDILDLLNLSNTYDAHVFDADKLASTAERMLGWLLQMCHPDGRISFFNDAAFGVAPEPVELLAYARRLGIAERRERLSDSGYIRLERGDTVVLFDAAPVGPDYQPGHAHADSLSFECSSRGGRVIVNSGTSTYERDAERHRQRSTPAHSTVTIDNRNSSDVWSSFRVGRRARPIDIRTDHRTFAEASHTGYQNLPGKVIHRRSLRLTEHGLEVVDAVIGGETHSVEIAFHLPPGGRTAIDTDPAMNAVAVPSTYHPGFNISLRSQKVVASYAGKLPVHFRTFVRLT